MIYWENEKISKMENSTDVCLKIEVFLSLQYTGPQLDSQFQEIKQSVVVNHRLFLTSASEFHWEMLYSQMRIREKQAS